MKMLDLPPLPFRLPEPLARGNRKLLALGGLFGLLVVYSRGVGTPSLARVATPAEEQAAADVSEWVRGVAEPLTTAAAATATETTPQASAMRFYTQTISAHEMERFHAQRQLDQPTLAPEAREILQGKLTLINRHLQELHAARAPLLEARPSRGRPTEPGETRMQTPP